jgi:hypothetical protein
MKKSKHGLTKKQTILTKRRFNRWYENFDRDKKVHIIIPQK